MRTGLPGLSSRLLSFAAAIAMASMLHGCKGADGAQGVAGAPGVDGQPGSTGNNGTNGKDGKDGDDGLAGAQIANFHGVAAVTAEDEEQGTELVPPNPKYLANLTITSASASAGGTASVTFTVKAKDGVTPVLGLTAFSAGIFKLAPKEAEGRGYNRWVPYIYRGGRTVNAGYRESTTSTPVHGTLVENGAGSYTYTFGTNLATARLPFDTSVVPTTTAGPLVGFDRSLTHRVSVYIGGHAGPTGEADFDFVPDGVTPKQTRDIVKTATCKKCHGAEFRGHGGDRVTVEGCNACHSPDGFMVNARTTDPVFADTSIESIAMQVMIHKIHAGRELKSAPGPDGKWFDDPATPEDETLDNGTYRLGSLTATWRSAAFPARLENCVACHTGGGADVDNWKKVPSRDACGSCHDNIDWTTGAGHEAGAFSDDTGCHLCHPASGVGFAQSVESAHDFMSKDPRNIPEFIVSVSTSRPANGKYYVAGESPVVKIVLKDAVTNNVIDHTTVVEDPTAEGCTFAAGATSCIEGRDGLFRAANMYVTGPRAKRLPALTYNARAKVLSANVGPWALAAGAQLRVVVDSGTFYVQFGHEGEDVFVPGDYTVALPATAALMDAAFVNSMAVTPAQLATWLNTKATYSYSGRPAGDPRTFNFGDRAIAYVDEATGKLGIRSRALGFENPNIQIPDAAKGLGVFTDTAVKVAGSSVQVRKRSTPSNNDPRVSWFTDRIEYQLDPVDDLAAGTYMINVEFMDRGNLSETNYKTPSVAVVTFQVKTATVELPIAGNCTSCHWSTNAVGQGVGFVMDPRRHNKPFNATAIDQCGGCHDYASGEAIAATATGGVGSGAPLPTWSTGGGTKPIGKRVHAVHNGSALFYPTLTVDHEESVAGRGWRIVYPMDIRNCESCHPNPDVGSDGKPVKGTGTSGTWKTKASRIACMGCHDSDVATAHMKTQVYDPTPLVPWSGDEEEACAACH